MRQIHPLKIQQKGQPKNRPRLFSLKHHPIYQQSIHLWNPQSCQPKILQKNQQENLLISQWKLSQKHLQNIQLSIQHMNQPKILQKGQQENLQIGQQKLSQKCHQNIQPSTQQKNQQKFQQENLQINHQINQQGYQQKDHQHFFHHSCQRPCQWPGNNKNLMQRRTSPRSVKSQVKIRHVLLSSLLYIFIYYNTISNLHKIN